MKVKVWFTEGKPDYQVIDNVVSYHFDYLVKTWYVITLDDTYSFGKEAVASIEVI